MNQERLYKVLLGSVLSEKSAALGEVANQYVFKVAKDASKYEVKQAIEKLLEVKVDAVRTLNVKGKVKRTRHGIGKQSDWKKAYVRVAPGQDINLSAAE